MCKRSKRFSEFFTHNGKLRRKPCRDCYLPIIRERSKQHYRKNLAYYTKRNSRYRTKIAKYINRLKNKPCQDCKKSYPPYVMDFDHVRGKKKFAISKARKSSVPLEEIDKEIAKCDLVCANCHRIRTFKRHKK